MVDSTAKKKVLFICTHNSARSQMAEGLLRHLHGDRFQAYSAGTDPTVVQPDAITVMAEIGIDISEQYSKSSTDFLHDRFDHVVTVCDRAKGTCPVFPGAANVIHKSFEDPAAFEGSKEETMAKFRGARSDRATH